MNSSPFKTAFLLAILLGAGLGCSSPATQKPTTGKAPAATTALPPTFLPNGTLSPDAKPSN